MFIYVYLLRLAFIISSSYKAVTLNTKCKCFFLKKGNSNQNTIYLARCWCLLLFKSLNAIHFFTVFFAYNSSKDSISQQRHVFIYNILPKISFHFLRFLSLEHKFKNNIWRITKRSSIDLTTHNNGYLPKPQITVKVSMVCLLIASLSTILHPET